jgi:hypothetical protein
MHVFVPFEQGVPSALLGFKHTPVATAQVPMLWHSSRAMQTTDVPEHAPAWQVSVVVHASLSLHAVLSAFGVTGHRPVAATHAAASWH